MSHQCQGKIKGPPCRVPAEKQVNGKWLCHLHDPEGNHQRVKAGKPRLDEVTPKPVYVAEPRKSRHDIRSHAPMIRADGEYEWCRSGDDPTQTHAACGRPVFDPFKALGAPEVPIRDRAGQTFGSERRHR